MGHASGSNQRLKNPTSVSVRQVDVDDTFGPRQNITGTKTVKCSPCTWRGSRISGEAISSRSIAPPDLMSLY